MENLQVKASEVEVWHTFVTDASAAARVELTEDSESYLVFLLMRLTEATYLATNIVTLDYLRTFNEPRAKRQLLLRDIGDKCLILAGLFPGIAIRRRVRVSYFVQIGRSAYQQLAILHERLQSDLYAGLSQQFVQMVDVLHAARKVNPLEPLQAVEFWEDTASHMAYQRFDGTLSDYFNDKKKLH